MEETKRNMDDGNVNELNPEEMQEVSGAKKRVTYHLERIRRMEKEELHNRVVAMQEKTAQELAAAERAIHEKIKRDREQMNQE